MSQADKYNIQRCLDGHADEFRYLVRRYQAALLAYLAGQLGSKDRAEEAAQETLVRAYFSLGKLRKRESFFAWLLGIASRVAKEDQRGRQRRRQIAASLCQKAQQPEYSADYALERAIGELPEPYRKVILLRYYGDRSCSEVAEQLDMPLGTVTKTLSRAYSMLRKSLSVQSRNENCEVQR